MRRKSILPSNALKYNFSGKYIGDSEKPMQENNKRRMSILELNNGAGELGLKLDTRALPPNWNK